MTRRVVIAKQSTARRCAAAPREAAVIFFNNRMPVCFIPVTPQQSVSLFFF